MCLAVETQREKFLLNRSPVVIFIKQLFIFFEKHTYSTDNVSYNDIYIVQIHGHESRFNTHRLFELATIPVFCCGFEDVELVKNGFSAHTLETNQSSLNDFRNQSEISTNQSDISKNQSDPQSSLKARDQRV